MDTQSVSVATVLYFVQACTTSEKPSGHRWSEVKMNVLKSKLVPGSETRMFSPLEFQCRIVSDHNSALGLIEATNCSYCNRPLFRSSEISRPKAPWIASILACITLPFSKSLPLIAPVQRVIM